MNEHHVVLEERCGCARRACMPRIVTCDDRVEAEEQAYEIAAKCNDNFCGKHGFDVVEVDEHYVVSVEQGGFVETCEI